MSVPVNVIYAVTDAGGIGIGNELPWPKIKDDFKHFRNVTSGEKKTIIMGSTTARCFPKALPNRKNVVLSSKPCEELVEKGFHVVKTIADCVREYKNGDEVYFIGGAKLFNSLLDAVAVGIVYVKTMYVSEIKGSYVSDVFMPAEFTPANLGMHLIREQKFEEFTLKVYNHVNKGELEYIRVVEKALNCKTRKTRNAITRSYFGDKIEFDMRDGFPLLTGKYMPFKTIVEEMLFLMSGRTDTSELSAKGIKIWEKNTSGEVINGKRRKVGEMGPMYGYQLRTFNGEKKFDQLEKAINLLKNDPMSRRIIMTTLNPLQVDDGVLYPCHGIAIQFWCDEDEKGNYIVNISMTQRSADIFLGLPFNIASYASFLHMICAICGPKYIPGRLVINLGDTHIYEDHIDAVKKYLEVAREGYKFPVISLKPTELDKFTIENFSLSGYYHHPRISAVMIP